MTLSSYRKHKIYLAAIMGYGLGSEHPEEVQYYQQLKEEIKKDIYRRNMGISRTD
tara:strand:+ start:156 stop:320 length:165 start_codon:yes stop_codon:yes gene_type:complete